MFLVNLAAFPKINLPYSRPETHAKPKLNSAWFGEPVLVGIDILKGKKSDQSVPVQLFLNGKSLIPGGPAGDRENDLLIGLIEEIEYPHKERD